MKLADNGLWSCTLVVGTDGQNWGRFGGHLCAGWRALIGWWNARPILLFLVSKLLRQLNEKDMKLWSRSSCAPAPAPVDNKALGIRDSVRQMRSL